MAFNIKFKIIQKMCKTNCVGNMRSILILSNTMKVNYNVI